jgi:hypothetical protein
MSLVLPGGTETEMPANLDRSRLPPEYPSHERSRVSALRAARAVVKAVEKKSAGFIELLEGAGFPAALS